MASIFTPLWRASDTILELVGVPGVFHRTVRIGVTGLSRAGKTAFLTSVAANLLGREAPRWVLAPLGASGIPRFDHPAHLAALAADPPRWPSRTNTVSILALEARLDRSPFPDYSARVEFLDYPGEWLLDLPLLAMDFGRWSEATLARLRTIGPAGEAFLGFVQGLSARAGADEALAAAGARLYRELLHDLRDQGLVHLQPGRFLMPAPGPEPPWMGFFPVTGSGKLAALLQQRYDAYVEAVHRDLASPLFSHVDRLVILADVLSALHAGEAAFADTRAALAAASGALRWQFSWAEVFDALRRMRLPPRVIDRVAFIATKADHVSERQRGNLVALLKNLARLPEGGVRAAYFAAASVRCTEDFVWTLEGRPVSAVRGRVLGQRVLTRSYPGEVPDHPPDAEFWEHPFLALPEFEPMVLPEGGRLGVPNIGLDAVLDFLLEDVA